MTITALHAVRRLKHSKKITDEPLKECPHCSNSSLVRGVGGGAATFCFKGSGFYITDYKEGEGKQKNPGCGCSGSHSCG